MSEPLLISDKEVTIAQLVDVAHRRIDVQLSDDPTWRDTLLRGRKVLEDAAYSGQIIYGVNTGFGRTSRRHIEQAHASLQQNLIRMHGCGVGPFLSPVEARAIMVCRLVCLAKGYSGIRPQLLEALCDAINAGITPAIPSFGSVGASGDLTPLSYLGAMLTGERQAHYNGELMSSADALKRAGLKPFTFAIREGLALINGTSMMTALAALLVKRTERVLALAERASAIALEMVDGRPEAMHPTIHKVKPHPGQRLAAANIKQHIEGSQFTTHSQSNGREVQDRYSIRCAPHLIGATRDALTWVTQNVHTELNSVNDNPIVDPDTAEILNGGNFYGGHIALSMDLLKISLGNVLNLFDRQFALLIGDAVPQLPETMLPQEWVPQEEQGLHHGLKALQITVSSLTALAHQRTLSDTLMSRQTECDNQDVVSMGTNASLNARSCLEFCELGLSAWLLALSQSVGIRGDEKLSPAGQALVHQIREHVPLVTQDRPLDQDVQSILTNILHQV
ncbi:MAG: histidine ammonia-lyase [Deltaproteobacteria bacterium]|nr:histidine ammonia-lyase [Deltaproteobacteria bacterium]MBU53891.1 histidine ammonia-lyase [Deltaproteobacteria bacterium]|tara:strand:+ start:1984 stop:3504 length:1521 start_codon:yes stop_codon:yes gene_type:complete